MNKHDLTAIIEYAHMAGQSDAGVDASFSNAQAYARDDIASLDEKVFTAPKIVQLFQLANNNRWQGRFIALGSDGVVYECGPTGSWELFIPPLTGEGMI